MIDIGVIGGDEAADTLDELYAMTDEPNISVTRIREDSSAERFNVLVINDAGYLAADFLNELTADDIVIINTDNKTLYNYLNGSRGRLITYGFSSKACVTASSVVDEAYECIQLCIQRSIPTLTGSILEPQEFSLSFDDTSKNIYCVLGAVTAALIAGMEVERFLV